MCGVDIYYLRYQLNGRYIYLTERRTMQPYLTPLRRPNRFDGNGTEDIYLSDKGTHPGGNTASSRMSGRRISKRALASHSNGGALDPFSSDSTYLLLERSSRGLVMGY
ncbi:hypothetical protein AVEN_103784-1 [Araneus ventricosus]|uniref:Uncharacterized protein n=1 Tax=Araneus ventricosus TaxID=182803 RepID=A0A4Y2GL16_ARAVE|nr:hypothetical protein AVEN_103784-1 [Araneus ventricosus]